MRGRSASTETAPRDILRALGGIRFLNVDDGFTTTSSNCRMPLEVGDLVQLDGLESQSRRSHVQTLIVGTADSKAFQGETR